MNKVWHVTNGRHYISDTSAQISAIEKGVWDVQPDEHGHLFLTKVGDQFDFDFKIYGLESSFIQRVEKTYSNTTGNLGILLNGVKGTGKTISGEIIANKLNNPIVMVGANFPGLVPFLLSIPQDITIFVDEYDKVFKGNIGDDEYEDREDGNVKGDTTLLGLMDGTLKTNHRRVFILTTNRRWLNDNMLNRPGRIRYNKNFSDLDLVQINEIIDDCLKDKKYKEDILTYLKPLKIITVDIVKAVISQVNIFDDYTGECCKDLNVETKEEEYKIYKIKGNKEEVIDENPETGYLVRALTNQRWQGNCIYITGDLYHIVSKPNFKEKIFVVSTTNSEKDAITIKVKKYQPTHRSFAF